MRARERERERERDIVTCCFYCNKRYFPAVPGKVFAYSKKLAINSLTEGFSPPPVVKEGLGVVVF
jgi:hypothetical protein